MLGKYDDAPADNNKGSYVTRQYLVDEIYKHFTETLKEETTDVSMLFHTCYYIYLSQPDFRAREQSFVNTANDALEKITKHVQKLCKEKYPNYIPHSRYWQFQFMPLDEDGQLDASLTEEPVHLQRGEVVVLSMLYAEDDYQQNTASGSRRAVMTVHNKSSVTIGNWAVNHQALRGVDIRGRNLFRYHFSLDGNVQQQGSHGWANLSYSGEEQKCVAIVSAEMGKFVNGDSALMYQMKSNRLQVSGKTGAPDKGGEEVLRIDSDEVLNPHLIIRRTSDKTFEVQAKGNTVLNETLLDPINDVWYPLINNSILLIDSDIQLRFTLPSTRV
ncbi:MAG: hypothetical protein K6B13_13140 [Prevotella sp.]|nr:hypothetical protein [Prevotella sp.]